jgi:hypothetical protein
MIATTLSIYYGIAFFPASHHKLESIGARPLADCHLDGFLLCHEQTDRQIIGHLFAFVFEAEMVGSYFLVEIDLEMLVKCVEVKGTVVKMIDN